LLSRPIVAFLRRKYFVNAAEMIPADVEAIEGQWPTCQEKGLRLPPQPSPLEGSVVSWCRPSWSSCRFRPPSWS
jgi:hypothetical protein